MSNLLNVEENTSIHFANILIDIINKAVFQNSSDIIHSNIHYSVNKSKHSENYCKPLLYLILIRILTLKVQPLEELMKYIYTWEHSGSLKFGIVFVGGGGYKLL